MISLHGPCGTQTSIQWEPLLSLGWEPVFHSMLHPGYKWQCIPQTYLLSLFGCNLLIVRGYLPTPIDWHMNSNWFVRSWYQTNPPSISFFHFQALYYLFAILGMELFSGVITSPNTTRFDPTAGPEVTGYGCGTYEQLEYWANNFDDFAVCVFILVWVWWITLTPPT